MRMCSLILRSTVNRRGGCLERTLASCSKATSPNNIPSISLRLIQSSASSKSESISASVSAAPFTSFFWRNDQWSADIRRRRAASQVATAKINKATSSSPAFELYDTQSQAQAYPLPSSSSPSSSKAQFLSSTILTSPLALSSNYPPSPSLVPYRPVPSLTPKRLLSLYLSLAKSRLSILIILTTMSSVALSPMPVSVPTLLATAAGTSDRTEQPLGE